MSLSIRAHGRDSRGVGSLGASGYTSENVKVGNVREALPYPPGKVKLAGTLGSGVAATGTITTATGTAAVISFTPRSRTNGGLSASATADLAGKTGVTHEVPLRAFINGSWILVSSQTCAEGVNSISVNLTNTRKPSPTAGLNCGGERRGYGREQLWYWNLTA